METEIGNDILNQIQIRSIPLLTVNDEIMQRNDPENPPIVRYVLSELEDRDLDVDEDQYNFLFRVDDTDDDVLN